MSDIIIITIADEDYVESWFSDTLSSNEKASQTFAVRSKTDKSSFTNKTQFLDVYAKRHQLENAVRVKQERKARTQSPKRGKKHKKRSKKPQSASRLRLFRHTGPYFPTGCVFQVKDHMNTCCPYPFRQCIDCLSAL